MTTGTGLSSADRVQIAILLDKLEVAIGEIAPRQGQNAPLIASMIEHVNGLRSLLGLVRPH
jgi:hypothetical protein